MLMAINAVTRVNIDAVDTDLDAANNTHMNGGSNCYNRDNIPHYGYTTNPAGLSGTKTSSNSDFILQDDNSATTDNDNAMDRTDNRGKTNMDTNAPARLLSMTRLLRPRTAFITLTLNGILNLGPL